jgi:hypothetical protein
MLARHGGGPDTVAVVLAVDVEVDAVVVMVVVVVGTLAAEAWVVGLGADVLPPPLELPQAAISSTIGRTSADLFIFRGSSIA